jgi:hypothetical protein
MLTYPATRSERARGERLEKDHRLFFQTPLTREDVAILTTAVDLMGRLSNPPETLACVADQGGYDDPLPRWTRSKSPKRPSAPRLSSIPKEKGQLSTPVQRRLSADEIDELARPYRDGASIDALGRRYDVHRTTVIGQLDRRGVPRRHSARKMTDSLVA